MKMLSDATFRADVINKCAAHVGDRVGARVALVGGRDWEVFDTCDLRLFLPLANSVDNVGDISRFPSRTAAICVCCPRNWAKALHPARSQDRKR